MELTIALQKNSDKHLLNLKSYLSRNLDDNVGEILLLRQETKEGEMSTGLITSLTAIIEAINSPLTELVKVLAEYVKTFRSDISIKTESGFEVQISSKKIDKDNIEKIVNLLMESQGKK